jgi:hypothetical protein
MVVVNEVNAVTPLTSMTIINISVAVSFSLIIVRERMRACHKLLDVPQQKMQSATMSGTVQMDPKDSGGGGGDEEEEEERPSQEEREDDRSLNMEMRDDADLPQLQTSDEIEEVAVVANKTALFHTTSTLLNVAGE